MMLDMNNETERLINEAVFRLGTHTGRLETALDQLTQSALATTDGIEGLVGVLRRTKTSKRPRCHIARKARMYGRA